MKMNLMEERDTIFDAELSFLSDVHDTSVRGSRSAVDGGGDPGGLGTGRVTKTHTSKVSQGQKVLQTLIPMMIPILNSC